MNNILRDLINTKNVTAFMNNVLVDMEDKRKHDNIVKKGLRKIKKNDLHVKPEKCI